MISLIAKSYKNCQVGARRTPSHDFNHQGTYMSSDDRLLPRGVDLKARAIFRTGGLSVRRPRFFFCRVSCITTPVHAQLYICPLCG